MARIQFIAAFFFFGYKYNFFSKNLQLLYKYSKKVQN